MYTDSFIIITLFSCVRLSTQREVLSKYIWCNVSLNISYIFKMLQIRWKYSLSLDISECILLKI